MGIPDTWTGESVKTQLDSMIEYVYILYMPVYIVAQGIMFGPSHILLV